MSGVSNTQPLRDLAARIMREHGWALADLARNCDGARQKSWFGKVLTAEHRDTLLREEELRALAAGLRVAQRVVRAADLAGHGLREVDGPGDALALPEAAELTPRQRLAVAGVIRAMLDPGPAATSDTTAETEDGPVLPITRAARRRKDPADRRT
jgi:hypothetical protein